MIKQYSKLKANNIVLWLFLVLLICYLLIGCADKKFIFLMAGDSYPTFLDANIYNLFSPNLFTFFLGPLYLMFIRQNYQFFAKPCILVRMGSFKRCWRVQVLTLFIESILFICVIHLFLMLRAAYFQSMAEYAENWINLLKCVLLQALGIFGYSFLFTVAASFLHSTIAGFGVTYFLMVIDHFIGLYSTSVIPYSYQFILIEPGTVNAFIFKTLIFIIFTIIFFFLFQILFDSRDYLGKEK